jgi:hypothetical protein
LFENDRLKRYLNNTKKIWNNENANVEDAIATSESLVVAESVKTKSHVMTFKRNCIEKS